MSRGLLRNKLPELRLGLEGRVREHHRFRLKQWLDHQEFVESKMAQGEEEIEKRMRPFEAEVQRLDTIPGVDQLTAWSLMAEVGVRMEQFPSAGHLVSWAGLCPGSFESAGKRLSGKTRKGNAALRRCLCQVGSVVSHRRDNDLSAPYRRWAARRGGKRAVWAVAHTVLVMAYHRLKHPEDYEELGADYFDRLNADAIRRSLVRRLERLGHRVILEPLLSLREGIFE